MYNYADNTANNYFKTNLIGAYVSYNSNPDLGTYFEIPDICRGGFNYFKTSPDFHIYNTNSSQIKAEVNWWSASGTSLAISALQGLQRIKKMVMVK